VNFIDTAVSYGPQVSEKVTAETLYPYPDHLGGRPRETTRLGEV